MMRGIRFVGGLVPNPITIVSPSGSTANPLTLQAGSSGSYSQVVFNDYNGVPQGSVGYSNPTAGLSPSAVMINTVGLPFNVNVGAVFRAQFTTSGVQLNGGASGFIFQPQVGGTAGCIYSTNLTPSNTNYVIAYTPGTTFINGVTGVIVAVNGGTIANLSASGLTLSQGVFGSNSYTVATLPSGVPIGSKTYATNARNVTGFTPTILNQASTVNLEAAGAGSGAEVIYKTVGGTTGWYLLGQNNQIASA